MGLRRSALNSENIGLIINSIKHALGRNIDGKKQAKIYSLSFNHFSISCVP